MTTLTNDGLLALVHQLGVQTLPLVLSVGPRQVSYREWTAAQERALDELTADQVLDRYGDVDPELRSALWALALPERELVARIFTEAGQVRVCLVRRGGGHVLAVRRGDTFDIRPIWADGSGDSLTRPVLNVLGSCPPAEVTSFSAVAIELGERLDSATTSAEYADAVHSVGVAERDATAYGLAFASCRAYAEVVAYAHANGVTDRSPGAVVVYDTARGRIVAAPGVAVDQQIWSTLTPGTDHRITQAISGLIELLPGGRWLSK
ncbi:ESX secretion-associated protein EspG [Nocardia sp. CA-107356]|uniref:ESX secretion-associated protein EspG n=1 Tax=Nocardia sp. CA-107356 TaxID=3239972 RepID=UPI003D8D1A93